MFSLEKIIEKICEHTNLDEDRVRKMILEKPKELSGLVSEEGAGYLVARELGVNLIREVKRQLKIKNLITGLKSVELIARVVKIFEPRDFEKNGRTGRVINVLLGDDTGVVRLSLWNEETELVESGKIKEGDVVRISRAYVKPDNRDNPELRLGRGSIERVEGVTDLPSAEEIEKEFSSMKRRFIRDFKDGQLNETRAALVQVFKRDPFFEICPKCGIRLKEDNGKWICEDHGEVQPKYQVMLSGIIDDGTGNIRAVFFRDTAEKLFGKTVEELREIAKKNMDVLSVFTHIEGLGKDFIFRGRVRKNDFTNRLEFIVNEMEEIDVKKEIENLLREIAG